MQHVRVGLESRGLFDASSDVSDPKKDASDFKSEAKRAKDAGCDLRQFAASTLPTLEEHLSLAQEAQKAASPEPRAPAKTSSTGTRQTGN
jgi:hypothetical protein